MTGRRFFSIFVINEKEKEEKFANIDGNGFVLFFCLFDFASKFVMHTKVLADSISMFCALYQNCK